MKINVKVFSFKSKCCVPNLFFKWPKKTHSLLFSETKSERFSAVCCCIDLFLLNRATRLVDDMFQPNLVTQPKPLLGYYQGTPNERSNFASGDASCILMRILRIIHNFAHLHFVVCYILGSFSRVLSSCMQTNFMGF